MQQIAGRAAVSPLAARERMGSHANLPSMVPVSGSSRHRRTHSTARLRAADGDGGGAAAWEAARSRCEDGDPDIELCDLDEVLNAGTPSKGGEPRAGAAFAPPAGAAAGRSVPGEALARGRWLLGLLVLQSTSSFVLDSYQDLIRSHLVVTLFLTMLVGAGGNAGNQSAIKVIRGLATGAMRPTLPSFSATLRQQAGVGLLLGVGLAAGGYVRVAATNGDATNAAAISLSLFLIVVTSVLAGTALPFALARAGVDPANAGTSIQVLMDVLGVAITCVCCHWVLDQLQAGVAAAAAVAA